MFFNINICRSNLDDVKQLTEIMHEALEPWNCRAGQNTLIIRVHGTLAPCFPMYSATHDWGVVASPTFDRMQLSEMKSACQKHCFSTLNHIVGWCYNDRRVISFILKQAKHGFQGVRGQVGE